MLVHTPMPIEEELSNLMALGRNLSLEGIILGLGLLIKKDEEMDTPIEDPPLPDSYEPKEDQYIEPEPNQTPEPGQDTVPEPEPIKKPEPKDN